jgi:phosphoribosylglycinamide formyltransferase-1
MRVLSPGFVNRYKNKILNIHPALLPSFKGTQGIRDAFDYGVKVAGVSVHFVDEEMDHGPIILQKALYIDEKDTPESLEAKVHKIEHRLYPEAIRLYVEGRLRIEGRKVRISTPLEKPNS